MIYRRLRRAVSEFFLYYADSFIFRDQSRVSSITSRCIILILLLLSPVFLTGVFYEYRPLKEPDTFRRHLLLRRCVRSCIFCSSSLLLLKTRVESFKRKLFISNLRGRKWFSTLRCEIYL
jgi:hypothetical protein